MTLGCAGPVIRTYGLLKRYGTRPALRWVDLEVASGERLALLGPNGSGKTTLLKVLAGLLSPSQGRVEISGTTFQESGTWLRGTIGVLSHHTYLYQDLTGEENLMFFGRMFGVGPLRQRVKEALALAGLEARGQDRVGSYSRGMQQRLGLARACLHDPDILLLDEPDTGLDQDSMQHLTRFLERDALPRTVVMATHDLALGRGMCDRFAIMSDGRIVVEGECASHSVLEIETLYKEQSWARRTA